jgi:hypothetical protein
LFGFEGDGGWRKLYNEDSHNVNSPDIRMTKSRRIRWEGHVAHTREMISACLILVVKSGGRRYLGIDGRIKLKCV